MPAFFFLRQSLACFRILWLPVWSPETTIRTLDRLSKPGERSRLIDKAVLHYAATRSVEGLRERLKEAALRDRDLDRETAGEWSAVD